MMGWGPCRRRPMPAPPSCSGTAQAPGDQCLGVALVLLGHPSAHGSGRQLAVSAHHRGRRLAHLGGATFTLQRLFAYAFWPIMWLIGILETETAATLMAPRGHQDRAQRIRRLSRIRAVAGAGAEPRSRLIMTYVTAILILSLKWVQWAAQRNRGMGTDGMPARW
jgi:hypothetical protein